MLKAADMQKLAESELRDAIAREEFELHYQPVISVETRTLCGAEALVRWRHPTRGLVAPDQFIPLAESTGLIVQLGEWVLRRACKDACAWPAHVKLAVNISAVQFRRGNLFDTILRILLETGLPPDRLELEITETALLDNQEAHLATIRRLKNLGISMALDDFGTGYSAVNYLTIFPFDKIKIDKSFTQGVLNRRDCKAVIASTLALAQGLGTVTTAEGIETEEQFEYLRNGGRRYCARLSVRPTRSALSTRPARCGPAERAQGNGGVAGIRDTPGRRPPRTRRRVWRNFPQASCPRIFGPGRAGKSESPSRRCTCWWASARP